MRAPAAITADEARSRAVAHLSSGSVTRVERETEHGRTVWKVDVRRGTEVTEVHVDTATGTVTPVEQYARDDRGSDDRGSDDRGSDDRGSDDRGSDDLGTDDRRDDHGGRHGRRGSG